MERNWRWWKKEGLANTGKGRLTAVREVVEEKSRSGMKKTKWGTSLTPWENCKIIGTTNLERGVVS